MKKEGSWMCVSLPGTHRCAQKNRRRPDGEEILTGVARSEMRRLIMETNRGGPGSILHARLKRWMRRSFWWSWLVEGWPELSDRRRLDAGVGVFPSLVLACRER
jgi:hypothetical protein